MAWLAWSAEPPSWLRACGLVAATGSGEEVDWRAHFQESRAYDMALRLECATSAA